MGDPLTMHPLQNIDRSIFYSSRAIDGQNSNVIDKLSQIFAIGYVPY